MNLSVIANGHWEEFKKSSPEMTAKSAVPEYSAKERVMSGQPICSFPVSQKIIHSSKIPTQKKRKIRIMYTIKKANSHLKMLII